MRVTRARGFVAAGVIAIGAVVLAACGGGSSYGGSSNPSPAVTSGGTGAGAASTASANAAGGAENVVKMVEGQGDPTTAWKFEPAAITVKTGATVSFQNTGTQPHTATADDNSFDTGAVSVGEMKPVTFSKAGTFTFHCSFHPWMKGTVTVSDSGSSSSTGTSSSAPAAASVPSPMPTISSGSSGYGY